MAPPSLDHVQLAAPAGCEPQARAFFGGLFGLTEIEKPPALAARGGAWFALSGDQQLHIGVDPAPVPPTKAHPALRVDGETLDRLATALGAAGSPVRWDDELPGERRFYTEDPWGNRIELLARIAGRERSDGNSAPSGTGR